jgi:hypothetical protein
MPSRKRRKAADTESRGWSRMLKTGWWVVCLTILAWWIAVSGLDGAGASPADQRTFVLVTGVISFPGGALWLWALPSIREALPAAGIDPSMLPGYWETLAAWLGIGLIGHLQWFWLLPKVFRLRGGD